MNLQTVLELIFCVVDVLLPEPHFNLEKFKAGDDEAKSLAYVALETLEVRYHFFCGSQTHADMHSNRLGSISVSSLGFKKTRKRLSHG